MEPAAGASGAKGRASRATFYGRSPQPAPVIETAAAFGTGEARLGEFDAPRPALPPCRPPAPSLSLSLPPPCLCLCVSVSVSLSPWLSGSLCLSFAPHSVISIPSSVGGAPPRDGQAVPLRAGPAG
jgi:hypothetical protein